MFPQKTVPWLVNFVFIYLFTGHLSWKQYYSGKGAAQKVHECTEGGAVDQNLNFESDQEI